MSAIDTSGPAFPALCSVVRGVEVTPGITVRDWFAGKADVPWNAVIDTLGRRGIVDPTVEQLLEFRAELKYAEADAMLKARQS